MLTKARSRRAVVRAAGLVALSLALPGGCRRSREAAGQAGPSGRAATQPDERVSDLRQARSVAEGFLTALTKPSVDQAHGFCTPAQRKRVATITLPAGKVTWSIEKEAIAAGGREASFTGHFDSSAGKQAVVVLVIKVSDSGQDRWLVDACSIGG